MPSLRDSLSTEEFKQNCTFSGIFSGAGGASRGPQSVGLHVRLAVDDDDGDACKMLQFAFPDTDCRQMKAQNINLIPDATAKVDILDISFSC